jgi:hypothetical protein
MLKTEEEIKAWLDDNGVKNYTINKDLTVDVKGSITINIDESELPVQFNTVNGYFSIANSKNLKSLKGCPKNLEASFSADNTPITNCEGIGKVGGMISLKKCKKLKSLKGLNKNNDILTGPLVLMDCDELTSLKGCSSKILKNLRLTGCKKLKSFIGGPKEVGNDDGVIYALNTGITSPLGMPKLKSYDDIYSSISDIVIDKYLEMLGKIGYDKTQKFWPTIEKMLTLGD